MTPPMMGHDNHLVGDGYGDILLVCTCGAQWTLAAPADVASVRRAWDIHLEEAFRDRLNNTSRVMRKWDAATRPPPPPAPEGFVQGRDDPGDRP